MIEEFNEQEGPDLERLCQGVSPNDEPCSQTPPAERVAW